MPFESNANPTHYLTKSSVVTKKRSKPSSTRLHQLWLKEKETALIYLTAKLSLKYSSNIVFSVNDDYFYFISKKINDNSRLSNLPQQLFVYSIWMLYPPKYNNRLGGWKESNLLYAGSLTYHS